MSFNSIFGLGSHSPDASLKGLYWGQDDAASATIDDALGGTDGTLSTGNSEDFSGTGPNLWLAKGLEFSGSESVTLPILLNGVSAITVFGWFRVDTFTEYDGLIFTRDVSPYSGSNGLSLSSGAGQFNSRIANNSVSSSNSVVTVGNWQFAALRYTGSNQQIWTNGSQVGTGSKSGSVTVTDNWRIGYDDFNAGRRLQGAWAGVGLADKAFSDAEFDEAEDGPEPISFVAPSLSGTETEGQTLTCSSGTWGLDSPFSGGSNGTITYSYQWTRSDDGAGTGEANIGGSTSSTYTLQAGDVGKYLRCYVRASNDGGHDVAADTASNFSGAIVSSGGGPITRGGLLLAF